MGNEKFYRIPHTICGQMKLIISLLMVCVISLSSLTVNAGKGRKSRKDESSAPYFRFDGSGKDDSGKNLRNDRYLIKGQYSLKDLDDKYGLGADYEPNLEGMDSLNISGSGQFSEKQFLELGQRLTDLAGDKEIYFIDLRQESHAFLNGQSVSWHGPDNAANEGMTLSQVEADEAERFGKLSGTTITVCEEHHKEKDESVNIDVKKVMSEKELVEGQGYHYLRLPATDHKWPDEYLIDEFIEFVKGIDMDHSWLHFHCHAGQGRTGVFMCIYDMMKNPGVSVEDIVARQAMTGSSYLLKGADSDSAKSSDAKKAKRIRQVYQYIRENKDTGYAVPWSQWVEKADAAAGTADPAQMTKEAAATEAAE